MNGIATTLTSLLVVASGASVGYVLDLGVLENQHDTGEQPLPALPGLGNVTLPPLPFDHGNETYENETEEYDEYDEDYDEEDYDGSSGCNDGNATSGYYEDETYYSCGTYIDESHVMVGPTTQRWEWTVGQDSASLYVNFHASGAAAGLPFCGSQGSNVRLYDGSGTLVASAQDDSALGLGGFLDLYFDGSNGFVSGQWSLEFEGCYVTGDYWVYIAADCREEGTDD